jgi:DNA invertase Pin-like site-specific DNA recombinase
MTKTIKAGYIRVSSELQNTQRQLDGIQLDRRYEDKVSGKDANRPELQRLLTDADLLGQLKTTLYVHSMDRLARNAYDLRDIVRELTGKGVVVQFVKEGLTFTGEDSPMSNLLLAMLGSIAEFERSLIKERQLEGIAIAKREKRYKGRKPSLTDVQVADAKAKIADGTPKAQVARELGVSRETLYHYLREAA